MKSLLLILLLIPSISIAGPLIGCDSDDVVRELRNLEIVIMESQRPPQVIYIQPQPEPKRQHKELTEDERMEALAEHLNNQLWENSNDN
jgi:hypothetical protein